MTIPRRENLSNNQRAILTYLAQHGGPMTTLRDVAEALGLNTNGVSQAGGALEQRELIDVDYRRSKGYLDSCVQLINPAADEPQQLPLEPSP